ncbi:MAG: PRC-barrel domain-containing protein [Ginsengibacter sp.]
MQRNINNLSGFTIGATDGEIGKVEEFYFDDTTWTIRYMIVKTGGWLTGREVLISPVAILAPDWESKIIPVNLTRKQVEDSPDIDTDKPISRQEEEKLFAYYPWQSYYDAGLYGDGMGMMGVFPLAPLVTEEEIEQQEKNEAPKKATHLRSTHELKGYTIHAEDGEIGTVADFILDDKTWQVSFIVVKTGNLFSHKKVLISPQWIKEVKWSVQEFMVSVNVEDVKNSPEYDASKPVESSYTKDLHDHYGFSSNS